MNLRLETRVGKLEAKHLATGRDVFEELSGTQAKALVLLLEAEKEGREEDCTPADLLTDDLLWRNGFSRESYNAAIAGITIEQFERMVAYVRAKAAR